MVNTYGETKSFFKICKTVFLGGSIVEHGGQNPLEAVRYGCRTLHGPNIWNFKEIYSLLSKFKVSYEVDNVKQITRKITRVFSSNKNNKNIKSKLDSLSNKILKLTLKEIDYFIIKK